MKKKNKFEEKDEDKATIAFLMFMTFCYVIVMMGIIFYLRLKGIV